ncbi:hypothetical protein HHI36_000834 [Cryptolaemus montrouzieri]|uniref:Lipocalin/cytosolic fatty-acid binding domain-containing protein n=1 Tax=Cryptolaemus montrouzieri TaxID=559131 RepID=A0ABD2P757_9CUCU
MMKYLALILVFLVIGSNCQIVIKEKCPDVTVQQNFDTKKWSGTWYLVEAYSTSFLQSEKCVDLLITQFPNKTVGLQLTTFNIETNDQSRTDGRVNHIGPNGDGKLSGYLNGTFYVTSILETDYENYSVDWTCQKETDETNDAIVWILTRTPNPSDEIRDKYHNVLDRNGISRKYLHPVEQKDCPKRVENNTHYRNHNS